LRRANLDPAKPPREIAMMCKRRSLLAGLLIALFVLSLPVQAAPASPVPAASSVPSPRPCDTGTMTTIAGNGCCQDHKGVCGCRAGRIVCCDGSASDTCSCHQESEQGPRM